MNVLLVEDEAPKLSNLCEFLKENYPDFHVTTAKSVRSAVDELRKSITFDLIILDMSLPTFDIENGESGGAPQGFGGLEVMRFIERTGKIIPVIIVTAYTAFDEGTKTWGLDELRNNLADDYPDIFRGLVYYNIVYGTWISELRETINKEIGGIGK